MKDLTLGDAHFNPIDDLMQRDVGSDMVCSLFIASTCVSVWVRVGVYTCKHDFQPCSLQMAPCGGSNKRVWWQVVWYQALSSEHWSAESSQDGQEEER